MSVSVVKSYVWHGDECFFVSTINRKSSSEYAYEARYNETMVWEYDWDTAARGAILNLSDDRVGSATEHYRVCELLRVHGREGLKKGGQP